MPSVIRELLQLVDFNARRADPARIVGPALQFAGFLGIALMVAPLLSGSAPPPLLLGIAAAGIAAIVLGRKLGGAMFTPPELRTQLSPELLTATERALVRCNSERRPAEASDLLDEVVSTSASRAFFDGLGVDAQKLIEDVRDAEGDRLQTRQGGVARFMKFAPELEATFSDALIHRMASDSPPIELGIVLATAMKPPGDNPLAEGLSSQGINLLDIRNFVSHGTRTDPALAPIGNTPVAVVMHNDPFSTRELVLVVLRTVLHMDADQAQERMQLVHDEGEAELTKLPPQEAVEVVENMRRAAQANDAPLRFSLR